MASSTFSFFGSRPANPDAASTPTTPPPNPFSFSDNTNSPFSTDTNPNNLSSTPTHSPSDSANPSQFPFANPNLLVPSASSPSSRSPEYSNQLLSLNALALSPKAPASFLPIYPTQLLSHLSPPIKISHTSTSTTLVIDIRPRFDFLASHIINSVGFNLPTTLLRRPLYGLDRIYDSLETTIDKARFNRYKTCLKGHTSSACDVAPLERIVVLDADSRSVNPSHPLTLVLRKFEQAGFAGELVWLYGGFEMLITDESVQPGSVLENSDPSDLDAHMDADGGGGMLRMSLSLPPSLTGSPPLSTHTRPPSASLRIPRAQLKRPPISLSMLPVSLPAPAPAPPPNPFFDNIRQLTERLSLDASLQNLAPFNLPPLAHPQRDLPRLPPFIRRLVEDSPTARATRLAHEFHDLEMAEQRRLQDVMRWESSRGQTLIQHPNPQISLAEQSPKGGVLDGAAQHPFSISAGVELGYKNRYKNIWPYEHTRIRLSEGATRRNGTDYVNASLISFRVDGAPARLEQTDVGRRQYIATQGPLASTFEDFWSVVGAQDVGLIVMITRRHEAGREKCGDYVRNGQYGEMVVCVDAGEAGESDSEAERAHTGGFFAFGPSRPARLDGVVQKTLKLSRAARPDLPPRQVAHIQYQLWPDFDVPPAVDEVLELVTQCQTAVKQVIGANERAVEMHCRQTGEAHEEVRALVGAGAGPVVVHCSAGVGRTGSFIVLDLMMEVLKAQYGAAAQRPGGGVGTPAAWEVVETDREDQGEIVMADGCAPREIAKVDRQLMSESMEMERAASSQEAAKMARDASREAMKMNRDASRRTAKMDREASRKTVQIKRDVPQKMVKTDGDASRETVKMDGNGLQEVIGMNGGASQERAKMERQGSRQMAKIDAGATREATKTEGDVPLEAIKTGRRALPETPKPGGYSAPNSQMASPTDAPDSRLPQASRVPRFLESELCDCQAKVAPIWQHNPVMAVVNEMREQRMSMVANYRQYVFVHEVLIKFIFKELEIPTVARESEGTSSRSNSCVNGSNEERRDGDQKNVAGPVRDGRIRTDGIADGGGAGGGEMENKGEVQTKKSEEKLIVVGGPPAGGGTGTGTITGRTKVT